ncbi:hypothetical protein EDD21DRAFT_57491 [Dissophora ornata]|nr:hypothetical protein EDD21DRAFT_57491 [Dissophora ornata]
MCTSTLRINHLPLLSSLWLSSLTTCPAFKIQIKSLCWVWRRLVLLHYCSSCFAATVFECAPAAHITSTMTGLRQQLFPPFIFPFCFILSLKMGLNLYVACVITCRVSLIVGSA